MVLPLGIVVFLFNDNRGGMILSEKTFINFMPS